MRRRVGLVLAIAVLSTAAVSSGAPRPPAPQVLGAEAAPPPAWVESGGRASWLAYSGYCWDTPFLAEHPYCVAVAEPALCRHLPQVVARPGALLRFHFGFAPRQVTVIVRGRQFSLQAAAVTTWRVKALGRLRVEAQTPEQAGRVPPRVQAGVGEYAACLVRSALVGPVAPSELSGRVVLWPASPVCDVTHPCTRPLPDFPLEFSADGRRVASVTTDAQARYSVRLAPGTYDVSSPRQGKLTPLRVFLPPGRVGVVGFSFDTGIR